LEFRHFTDVMVTKTAITSGLTFFGFQVTKVSAGIKEAKEQRELQALQALQATTDLQGFLECQVKWVQEDFPVQEALQVILLLKI